MIQPASAPGVLVRPSRLQQPVAATDGELVRAALDGSEPAFRELVQRYERPVIAMITRLIRHPARAEELAQDAFVKAFTRLDSYEPERKFSTWLLAIAHHAAVDELRRAGARTESLDGPDARAEIPDVHRETPAQAAERAELADAMDAAIASLRAEYRELVALRYEQELTYEEIAEITGLAVGTIKSYLHRARKELAVHLTAAGWGNPT